MIYTYTDYNHLNYPRIKFKQIYPCIFFTNGMKFEVIERGKKQDIIKRVFKPNKQEKPMSKVNKKSIFSKPRESEQKWILENNY